MVAPNVLAASLTVTMTSDVNQATAGQQAVISVLIDNNTGNDVSNVKLSVPNSPDWTLVPGSVTVNGETKPDSILGGYTLGTLSSDTSATNYVQFNISLVNTSKTIVSVNVSGDGVSTASSSVTINGNLSSAGTTTTEQNQSSPAANCKIDYTNTSNIPTEICNPLPQNNLDSFLTSMVKVILAATAGFAVIMIVTAGVRLVASGGNQEAVAGAKSQISWALIGLIIAILAYTIISVVINAFAGK